MQQHRQKKRSGKTARFRTKITNYPMQRLESLQRPARRPGALCARLPLASGHAGNPVELLLKLGALLPQAMSLRLGRKHQVHWPFGQPPIGKKPDESSITDVLIDSVSMNQSHASTREKHLAVPNDLVNLQARCHPDFLLAATTFKLDIVTAQISRERHPRQRLQVCGSRNRSLQIPWMTHHDFFQHSKASCEKG